MKRILIFLLAIGLISLYSCKKDEDQAVLSYFNPAKIVIPTNASEYTLLEVNKDSILFTFTWDAATYSLTDLVKPTYILEMDTMGNDFKSPVTLSSTQGYTFPITVGAMNDYILSVFQGKGDSLATLQFRVKASLVATTPAANNISSVVTVNFIPYSAIVILPPIYLLGDATTVGWSNVDALEMTHIGTAGEFAIVEYLAGGGKYLKFIANRGAWAPQWGTDAAGTPETGTLVYRPTESVPDPPAIPSPELAGDYRIVADTANLVYTVSLTSATLYLVGDGCDAGWTPENGLPFNKVAPGIFTLTTTLKAGGLKFLETTTGWAPQWGTDATGTSNFGPLVYRPNESVPDPASITSPGAGTYTININLATLKYEIVAK